MTTTNNPGFRINGILTTSEHTDGRTEPERITVGVVENRERDDYWAQARRAHEETKLWPQWKRDIRLTKYSIGFD